MYAFMCIYTPRLWGSDNQSQKMIFFVKVSVERVLEGNVQSEAERCRLSVFIFIFYFFQFWVGRWLIKFLYYSSNPIVLPPLQFPCQFLLPVPPSPPLQGKSTAQHSTFDLPDLAHFLFTAQQVNNGGVQAILFQAYCQLYRS